MANPSTTGGNNNATQQQHQLSQLAANCPPALRDAGVSCRHQWRLFCHWFHFNSIANWNQLSTPSIRETSIGDALIGHNLVAIWNGWSDTFRRWELELFHLVFTLVTARNQLLINPFCACLATWLMRVINKHATAIHTRFSSSSIPRRSPRKNSGRADETFFNLGQQLRGIGKRAECKKIQIQRPDDGDSI